MGCNPETKLNIILRELGTSLWLQEESNSNLEKVLKNLCMGVSSMDGGKNKFEALVCA